MPDRRPGLGSLAAAVTMVGLIAVTIVTLLAAPARERDRVQELSERLRCPVCKSVSIAESPSETAVAMRQVVAEQVAAGRTDQQIVDHFRARYGDWVLLDPPRRGPALLLWLAPLAVAALGGAGVLARARPRAQPPARQLTESARARVHAAVRRARADEGIGDQP